MACFCPTQSPLAEHSRVARAIAAGEAGQWASSWSGTGTLLSVPQGAPRRCRGWLSGEGLGAQGPGRCPCLGRPHCWGVGGVGEAPRGRRRPSQPPSLLAPQ